MVGPMPLTVYSCVTYAPFVFDPRTQDHWTALHFVKAVKRTPLSGYATLTSPRGDTIRIDEASAGEAPQWFADLAIAAAPWRELVPCGLVPIPDARCDLAANRRSHTHALAEALVSALGADVAVVDVLRWSRPMETAHGSDGSRDPQVLYGRLRLSHRALPLAGLRLVLVDDVVASGAHLRAAAAFLTDCRAEVLCAVCAGRASQTIPACATPLMSSVDVLTDFQPDPDWLLPEMIEGVEL